jgi:hypothetical protein
MTDAFSQLPWEDLRRTEGDLPWPALETFADAAVSSPDLAQELFTEYDRAWQAGDIPTYINLYIPAIFALVAPKLGDPQRREIGSLLLDRLMEAGKEGASLTKEALLAAAGSMRPILLPKILDMLDSMPQNEQEVDAWPQCWNLTALAIKTEDATIRDRTIRACIRLLEQIERGKYDPFLGISAAWTLALLKCTEAAPLLQRLAEQTDPLDGRADYKEALQVLEGRSEHVYQEAWDWPVREWLEALWRTTRKWYVRGDSVDSEEAQRALEEVPYELPDRIPTAPPIPIVEHSPKIGRNDPCPCGSGKKYKKCCGSPAKGQATNV